MDAGRGFDSRQLHQKQLIENFEQLFLMGLHWFRQRQEAYADDPRGVRRKRSKTLNCQ